MTAKDEYAENGMQPCKYCGGECTAEIDADDNGIVLNITGQHRKYCPFYHTGGMNGIQYDVTSDPDHLILQYKNAWNASPKGAEQNQLLSQREKFAAHALTGLCTEYYAVYDQSADHVAKKAYEIADAMLKAGSE